jgi:hypothetical protein
MANAAKLNAAFEIHAPDFLGQTHYIAENILHVLPRVINNMIYNIVNTILE